MTVAQETEPGPAGARFFDAIRTFLAVLLVAVSVAWAVNFFRLFGIALFTEQYCSIILSIGFLLTFLAIPARKGRSQAVPPWYDIVAGIVGCVAAGYMALYFVDLGTQMFFAPLDGLLAGLAVIVLGIEGIRRTVGWPLVITVLVFLAYGLWGHLIPGLLAARPTAPMQLFYYLAYDSNAVLGTPLLIVSTIVIAFVLFGNLLMATGGADFFNDIAVATMGRYRGGAAKIAIVSSALFGTVSGSAVANVVSGGIITIPMMIRAGYKPYQAAAIEAVSSTGGSLMPPVMGAAAFVMAEYLQISYGEVMIYAAIPSILYFSVLFIVADLEAARMGILRIEESMIPSSLAVLRAGWHFILPFAVIAYTLFWMNMQPDESALYASLSVLLTSYLFGYNGRRPSLIDIFRGLRDAGIGILDLLMICVGAGVVIGVLSLSGLGFGLTLALVTFAKHSLLLLLMLAALCSIVLGMGMPTVAVYVLLAALVAPAMVESGVLPAAAHMFVLYFGMMSFITPPVAVAAFAAASLGKADPFRTAFDSMRFGWCAYIVPFLFVYSPTLILVGDWVPIVVDFVTALIGIWLISMCFVGFALRPISWLERIAFAVAGTGLLMPLALWEYALYCNIGGALFAIALLAQQWKERARAGKGAAAPQPGTRGS